MALIIDSYGREVPIPRVQMTIAGTWKSLHQPTKQTVYTISLNEKGEISSLTKAHTNMWKAGAPFEIVQQPISGNSVSIFAAVRPGGHNGNFRLFKYDSAHPLEMDLVFTTRETDPQRHLIKLQRVAGEGGSMESSIPVATHNVESMSKL